MNQVSGNDELLRMTRDYLHFVTKFFEPINVSAMHIYHSALELSPLSSIIRRSYYHRRHTSLPRVIFGNQDSWDQWLAASCRYYRSSCALSPCGRFIAAGGGGVEIRDSLSFELLSTLTPTKPGREFMSQLTYSMDGRSVASTLGTLLVIWDVQTGGVAKEIEHGGDCGVSLAWSLNESTIGIISEGLETDLYTVHIYNVASGTMHSPGVLLSTDRPYLWACGASFRAMTTARDDEGCIINIFKVGTVLTKIESFHIRLRETQFWVGSFSQTTHRISISIEENDFVFDIRTSRRLLISGQYLGFHCFSSDGSLFGGVSVSGDAVRIWKYTSEGYTPWREFLLQHQFQATFSSYHCLRFSPTSSSLLTRSNKILRLWRLDGPPIVAHPNYSVPLITISRCGSYVAAGHRGGTIGHRGDSIVTITNLVSQTPLHSIDTGMSIDGLALTGNVLLVLDFTTIAAWRLTEEGTVDGVFVDRRAYRHNSIWTVSLSGTPGFSVGDQTVAIKQDGKVVHVYRTETGEVLEPTKTLLHHRDYSSWDMIRGLHHPRYHDIDLVPVMQRGWMKDPEGKHQLWIPVEWRNSLNKATSSGDLKTLRLDLTTGETILIKF